jgi:hypothetical protein
MQLRTLMAAAMGLTMAAGLAGAASAATPWQHHHPRRVEVNHRLGDLNRSIRHERAEGDLSVAQARRLHARTHMIRLQERGFASRHDGHLTRREQVRLNREESGVRSHIPS